ncbi:IclR family transcriptional regulator domain-containing protein [Streptomyces sp. FxanaA7]|uniref:IclR family transcriptional regulator domain-containing protein n=1 Tax=Streptomyces sp. FxanaA7 TaxID=1265492 RepID=UPI003B63E62E
MPCAKPGKSSTGPPARSGPDAALRVPAPVGGRAADVGPLNAPPSGRGAGAGVGVVEADPGFFRRGRRRRKNAFWDSCRGKRASITAPGRATGNPEPVGRGPARHHPAARSQWEVPRETRKVMRDLADRLGETVNVFVARDLRRVCVAHEESPHPLPHVVDIGDEQPLWAAASSKVLLRDASDTLLHRVAASSPHGEAYAEELRTPAQEAADRGYTVSSSEWDEGLTAVATPPPPSPSRRPDHQPLQPGHRLPLPQRPQPPLPLRGRRTVRGGPLRSGGAHLRPRVQPPARPQPLNPPGAGPSARRSCGSGGGRRHRRAPARRPRTDHGPGPSGSFRGRLVVRGRAGRGGVGRPSGGVHLGPG